MAGIDERADRWASTMKGHEAVAGIHLAHTDSWAGSGSRLLLPRQAREDAERSGLATLATKAHGAGERAEEEEAEAAPEAVAAKEKPRSEERSGRDRDRIAAVIAGVPPTDPFAEHPWTLRS